MIRRVMFALILASLVATPALAQQGQLNGVVSDTTGGVVPGATVTVSESETGLSQTTVSSSDGRYLFPSLRPTTYEIRVEIPGFQTTRRPGVLLQANQNVTVNITIQIGELTETVLVSGAAATVDITTATISEVVDHARIVELPLNGRNAAVLSTLVAGIIIGEVSSETGKSMPGGLRLSSNGGSNEDVTFRLDGASNNDPEFQENLSLPFPEALQEFSIQTSNYSASQGNQAGAFVSAVTRSGTNEYHGGVFGYLRDRTFNARPFFAPERDFLKRRQYGGYVGGPVKLPGYNGRNKTFFFAGWQGTSIANKSATANVFLPTDDMRQGNFATCGQACNRAIRDPLTGSPFPNNQIPVARFDPALVKLLEHLPRVQGDGLYQIPRTTSQDLNQVVVKVDHQLTAKDILSNRYFFDHFNNAPVYTPGNLATYRSGTLQSRTRVQNNVLSWKRTATNTLLNEFHVAYGRVHSRREPPPEGVPTLASLGIRLPLYPTRPSVQGLPFGIGDNLDAIFWRGGYEFSNRTSWVRGKHSVQFGGEAQFKNANIFNEFRRGGSYTFGSNATGLQMTDIFLGHMTQFEQGTGEYKNNRGRYYSAFFQDDYKIATRLSLNLGVRWEPGPPLREIEGRLQNFRLANYHAGVRSPQFDNAPVGVLFRGDPGVPYDGTNIDWNTVGVRLGAAWDLTGDGKTSLRSGWGMFYDPQGGGVGNSAVNGPPWGLTYRVQEPAAPFSDPYRNEPLSVFNSITPAAIGRRDAPFPVPVAVSSYDELYETPVAYNFNVTLEREVMNGWMARSAYVGSRFRKGRNTLQLNPAIYAPGATTATTDARRALKPYGGISMRTETSWSDYDSLQLTLNRRFANGFSINSNYTRAFSDGIIVGLIPYNLPQDPTLTTGPTTNWRKHRFVASWVYALPTVGRDGGPIHAVLSGWQITGIYQYQSGGPLTIVSGTDTSLDGLEGDRAVAVSGVSFAAPAGGDQTTWFNKDAFAVAPVGTWGTERVGTYTGPPLSNVDFGLTRNFQIGTQALQFRAEVFNIFNQVNFGDPNTEVRSGSFGRITSTHAFAGSPRIVQFGLKYAF